MARGKGTLRVRITGDAGPLKKTLGSAGGMIGKFAVGAGAAVGAAAAFSVKAFADFDQAMTNSTAIMGDVSDAMRKDMSDAAREVAKTTVFSATQAAESYFFLASAGLDAEQSIAALPRVAAFAQAGNFDMALATDLATDAQSALALTVDDATQNLENLTRVTDVLVKANTLANASVEQFATSLTQKGGEAVRRLGLEMEEGVAILAVFADQGLKAEQAGTILARTLDGLANQSRKNADAFEELGVKVFDGDGEMRNMADIVADLEGALGGMSTEQQTAALAQLGFNERAARGVGLLLGNSDALREYEEELRDAGGTTDEVANNQLQTFWAQLGLLKDQLVDVALTVGETLMPVLENLVSWLQENMPAIKANAEDLIGAIELLFTGTRTTGRESRREFGQHMEGIRSDGQETKSWIELNLIPVMRELRLGWDTEMGGLRKDQETHWTKFTQNARERLGFLGDTFRMFQGLFTGDWEQFWDGLKGMARRRLQLINDATGGGLSRQHRMWGLWMTRISLAVRDWWNNRAAPFFASLPDRITNFLRSLPGQLASIGRRAVDGLWAGFRAQWNRFTSWVSDLPGAGIVRNLAGALGIGSPSKVMAAEIGGPIVEGIEMGMESRFGNLRSVAAEIPDLIRSAESDARTSLADTTTPGSVRGATGNGQVMTVRLETAPGADSDTAALVNALVRKGTLRLSVNGQRVRAG